MVQTKGGVCWGRLGEDPTSAKGCHLPWCPNLSTQSGRIYISQKPGCDSLFSDHFVCLSSGTNLPPGGGVHRLFIPRIARASYARVISLNFSWSPPCRIEAWASRIGQAFKGSLAMVLKGVGTRLPEQMKLPSRTRFKLRRPFRVIGRPFCRFPVVIVQSTVKLGFTHDPNGKTFKALAAIGSGCNVVACARKNVEPGGI